MLETAAAKIGAARVENIDLKTALADDFSYYKTFGLTEPFDKIFFSYSISMIPPWRASIDNALENLRPGGTLFIVDFYDQKELPAAFRKLLKWWLEKFHVRFWAGLLPYLAELSEQGGGSFSSNRSVPPLFFYCKIQKILRPFPPVFATPFPIGCRPSSAY